MVIPRYPDIRRQRYVLYLNSLRRKGIDVPDDLTDKSSEELHNLYITLGEEDVYKLEEIKEEDTSHQLENFLNQKLVDYFHNPPKGLSLDRYVNDCIQSFFNQSPLRNSDTKVKCKIISNSRPKSEPQPDIKPTVIDPKYLVGWFVLRLIAYLNPNYKFPHGDRNFIYGVGTNIIAGLENLRGKGPDLLAYCHRMLPSPVPVPLGDNNLTVLHTIKFI